MQRVSRSARVPIAERFSPWISSPSRGPGTARSAASAGRSLIITSGVTKDFPRPAIRAEGYARRARPLRGQAISSRRKAPPPPAVSPYLASSTMLSGVSAALRICWKPPARITSEMRRSPACAPSARPVSCASEVGTQIIVEAE